MKSYLTRIFIIIMLIYFSGMIIGSVYDRYYKKKWGEFFFEKIETITTSDEKADILILGNSRMHSGLNPFFIDSMTHLKSYNLALAAAAIKEVELLSNLYLEKHAPPKIVVFGFDMAMLMKSENDEKRFGYLFYLNNKWVSRYVKEEKTGSSVVRYIPFLKYSYFDEYNRTTVFSKNIAYAKSNYSFYKGFINIYPFSGGQEDTVTGKKNIFAQQPPSSNIVDSGKVSTLNRIIDLYKSKGSEVLFLFPPIRDKIFSSSDSLHTYHPVVKSIIKRYNLKIIRADTSGLYNKEFFIDRIHLNQHGAKILSEEVGSFILNKKND